MVAAPQGSQLVFAPVQGFLAYQFRLGPWDLPPGFDVVQVRDVHHLAGEARGAVPVARARDGRDREDGARDSRALRARGQGRTRVRDLQ